MISAEATKNRLNEKVDLTVKDLIPTIMEHIGKAADNRLCSAKILIDNIKVGYSIRDKLKAAGYTAVYKDTRKYSRKGMPYKLTVSWGESSKNSHSIDPLYIKTIPEKVKMLLTAEETAKILIKKENDKLDSVYCDVGNKIMGMRDKGCHETVIGFREKSICDGIEKKLTDNGFVVKSYYDDKCDKPLQLKVSWKLEIDNQKAALINTQPIEQNNKHEDNGSTIKSETLPKEENKMDCFTNSAIYN